jgi:hypothetical protein
MRKTLLGAPRPRLITRRRRAVLARERLSPRRRMVKTRLSRVRRKEVTVLMSLLERRNLESEALLRCGCHNAK